MKYLIILYFKKYVLNCIELIIWPTISTIRISEFHDMSLNVITIIIVHKKKNYNSIIIKSWICKQRKWINYQNIKIQERKPTLITE